MFCLRLVGLMCSNTVALSEWPFCLALCFVWGFVLPLLPYVHPVFIHVVEIFIQIQFIDYSLGV